MPTNGDHMNLFLIYQTTLCVVYKDGEYPQDPYVPTIFENYAGLEGWLSSTWNSLTVSILATVTLDNRKYILNLFDSAGQVMGNELRRCCFLSREELFF